MFHLYTLTTFFILFLGIQVIVPAKASNLSLEDVWEKIYGDAQAISARENQVQASQLSTKRASRHWYPKLYWQTKVYNTDDPAYSFMGKLNQRSINPLSDFSANALNEPESELYHQHQIGLYMPIWEGGMRRAQVKGLKHMGKMSAKQKLATEIEMFAEVSSHYAHLVVLQKVMKETDTLDGEIKKIMKGYRIGKKSNPLGYSGLLGLQTFQTQIDGMSRQYSATQKGLHQALNHFSTKVPLSFNVSHQKPMPFYKKVLVSFLEVYKSKNGDDSFKVQSLLAQANAAKAQIDGEKARFRPHIGVFANYTMNGGDRSTEGSTMIGVQVNMSLYDGTNWGATKEASFKHQAAQAYALAQAQREKAQNEIYLKVGGPLLKTIEEMCKSCDRLKEQTKINRRLFRNGLINVLQFTEVLSRRAQMINHLYQANLEFIKMWKMAYINQAQGHPLTNK